MPQDCGCALSMGRALLPAARQGNSQNVQEETMKVSILGAGAVGSLLGGLIKHHQPDVEMVFIARGKHGEAMRRRGSIRLIGPWGTREVAATTTDKMAHIAGSDVVLLTVKS